jgi:hypothetical protein
MVGDKLKYPRVIIVTGFGLCSDAATDITLRSYFSQFPVDSLLLITTSNVRIQSINSIKVNSNFFSNTRIIAIKLFSQKKEKNRNLIPSAIISNSENKIGSKLKIFTIGASIRDMFDLKLTKKDILTIDKFNPDVIYTIMGNRRLIRLTDYLANRYNINIVPHFMDDWLSTIYTGSFFLKLQRLLLIKSLKKMMDKTKFGLGISNEMCKEYGKRFCKEFYPLMNTVPEKIIEHEYSYQNMKKDEINFTYLGGLHLNRWKTLLLLSEALSEVSAETKQSINLKIYTNHDSILKYSSQFPKTVNFYESVPHNHVINIMKSSDFLIHIESFDKQIISYTRLSISTKIPEYLASGIPILAIGPSNIASIEYLLGNNCGYISTSKLKEDIVKEIYRALKEEGRKTIIQNCMNLVNKNHSSNSISKFIEILAKSSNI